MSGTNSSTIALLSTFTSGDIVISISGDGNNSGSYGDNQASPIVLEEINPATGSIVGALTLPQTTTTLANGTVEYAISGEYGSSSEGALELSGDGQSLVIAGYGVNDVTYNTGGAAVYGNAALAQTTSDPGGPYTAVPRVIADIGYNGTVDTSTALFNVFNTNNPRSVATENGSVFYVSGQATGAGDPGQGLVVADDGTHSATSIDNTSDTRTVEIVNGQLFLSRDSKQVGGGEITTYGTTLPAATTTPTALPGIGPAVTLSAGQTNGINSAGQVAYLSPESYFFANSTTLYIADGGNPKEGGLGDGGLQKWTFNSATSAWQLDYTLSDGLNLVADTNAHGTSGLIGLTGTVLANGTVMLYTTNETIFDLDQTYLYEIADTLSATTLPQNETFTALVTAAPDSNIRGVAFAPAAATPATNITISSGTSVSGITVTNGGTLAVLTGGTAVGATVLSGGTASIYGLDSGSYIAEGGLETVAGTASLDLVYGTQYVSGGTVTNGIVDNNGAIIDLGGAILNGLTLNSGGSLILQTGTAAGIAIDGGNVTLASSLAAISNVSFNGTGTIFAETTAAGVSGLISGFAPGDVIDLTGLSSATSILALTISNGTTIAEISSGTVNQFFTFGSVPTGSSFALAADSGSGVDLILLPLPPGASGTISSGQTVPNLTVSNGGTLTVLAGGTAVNASILASGTELVSGVDIGSTLFAGGNQNISGTTYNDQVYGQQLVSAATAIVNNDTVFNGGTIELFLKGAVANNPTLNGGDLFINGNATAANAVILNGGTIQLQSPKAVLAGNLTFEGAGTLQVTSLTNTTSGIPFGDQATINGFGAGDVIQVLPSVLGSNGTVSTSYSSATNITTETFTGSKGSEAFIFAGSLANSAFAFNTATDALTAVNPNSTTIASGQTVSSSTISNGGTVTELAGGTLINTSVLSGGTLVVMGAASGTTLNAGGVIDVSGGTLSNTVIDGGTITLQNSLAALSGVTFNGTGTLFAEGTAGAGAGVIGPISGFTIGDVIDLTNFDATLTSTMVGTNTVETITDNGMSESYTFAGTYLPGAFALAPDGNGGTDLVLTNSGTVSAGQTDTGLTIGSGGTVTVLAGGTIINTSVLSGGTVLDMGLASATTLYTGGVIDLSGTGTLSNSILDGGAVYLQSPTAIISGAVSFAGPATILVQAQPSAGFGDLGTMTGFTAGDFIDLTTVASAGAILTSIVTGGITVETITAGGVAETFTFSGDPYPASDFTLITDGNGGTELTVTLAVVSNSITVTSGQVLVGETIGNGGTVTVLTGGTIINTTFLTGGQGVVSGTEIGSTIDMGGTVTVYGTASGDQIYGLQVLSGPSAGSTAAVSNETVYSGGEIYMPLKGAQATNIILNSGGVGAVSGNATFANIIINGGTLELESGKSNVTGGLTFSGTTGTILVSSLISAGSGNFETISGFGAGDVILIDGFGTGTTFSNTYVSASGVTIETLFDPNVTSSTQRTQSFTFAGSLAPSFFLDTTSGANSEITAAPCFASGTRILTPRGEVPVQDLAVGDLVITRDGADKPIKWIGKRWLNLRQHPRQEAVQPIRIDAGAFDNATPNRDLVLSPDHALYLNGFLVPAKALLNGANIVQLNRATVTYYHLELENHEVIFADGTMVETYLETGNRGAFDNGGEAVTLHPDFGQTMREAEGLAPFAETGPVVDSFKARAVARFRAAGRKTA